MTLVWRARALNDLRSLFAHIARYTDPGHAYEVLARMQNELQVCRTLPITVSLFYDRPFPVIHGELFTRALVEQITDPAVQRIAKWRLIGNINQWSDNTDMEGVEREKLQRLYM